MKNSRRKFLYHSSQAALGLGFFSLYNCGGGEHSHKEGDGHDHNHDHDATSKNNKEMFFKISLAQWSLNKDLFGGKLDNLDFAATAKNTYGVDGIEYVNQFFKDKAKDMDYLKQMKQRANDNGVKSLLIMIDGEGGLGDPNSAERTKAVENHYKWVDAAKFLGCHSIRVNAFGEGTSEEVAKAAVDGLGRLSEYGATQGLNVIVENHGSYSSNGKWLTNVMDTINKPNCGTLPDFGNFCVKRDGEGPWGGECIEEYDRYLGVTEMMKHAKAVSAKAHDFDANGNETHTDYRKMMKIVKDAGYRGYVGIEYEGSSMTPEEGIKATKALLEKVGKSLS